MKIKRRVHIVPILLKAMNWRVINQTLKTISMPLIMVAMLLVGIGLIYSGWQFSSAGNASIAKAPKKKPIDLQKNVPKLPHYFYKQKIVPLINTYAKRNHQAGKRAIESINLSFAKFRSRTPAFAKDMTAVSTQFGTIWRVTKDKWGKWILGNDNINAVKVYTKMVFAKDVLSRRELRKAILLSIAKFQNDIKANRNTLLSQTKLALKRDTLRANFRFNTAQFKDFSKYFNTHINNVIDNTAIKSLGVNIATIIGSTTAAIAGEQLANYILSYISINLASSAVVEGSALASGAAAGGGGGSTLGPAGTIIGIVSGLIVGGITAYFMQARFEKSIIKQTNMALDKLQKVIVKGDIADSKHTNKNVNVNNDSFIALKEFNAKPTLQLKNGRQDAGTLATLDTVNTTKWRGLQNIFYEIEKKLNNSTKKIMYKALMKGVT